MAELNSILTPVTADQFGLAVLRSLRSATRAQLSLLIAHWAGETGWGSGMHCWNPGNSKSSGKSGDWCYFDCDENVLLSTAEKLRADSRWGGLVEIRKTWTASDGKSWANVWFTAPHPWSRFQAFHSLDEGVASYLAMVRDKFPKSWRVLLGSADPTEYARSLKSEGYYTAGVDAYAKLLRGTLAAVERRAPEALAAVERVASESVPLS